MMTLGTVPFGQPGIPGGSVPFGQPGVPFGSVPFGQPGVPFGSVPFGQPGVPRGTVPLGQPTRTPGNARIDLNTAVTKVEPAGPLNKPHAARRHWHPQLSTILETLKKKPIATQPFARLETMTLGSPTSGGYSPTNSSSPIASAFTPLEAPFGNRPPTPGSLRRGVPPAGLRAGSGPIVPDVGPPPVGTGPLFGSGTFPVGAPGGTGPPFGSGTFPVAADGGIMGGTGPLFGSGQFPVAAGGGIMGGTGPLFGSGQFPVAAPPRIATGPLPGMQAGPVAVPGGVPRIGTAPLFAAGPPPGRRIGTGPIMPPGGIQIGPGAMI